MAAVQAKRDVAGVLNNKPARVKGGAFYDENDPRVRAWPMHFGQPRVEPLLAGAPAAAARSIEQATANPGEQRQVTRAPAGSSRAAAALADPETPTPNAPTAPRAPASHGK